MHLLSAKHVRDSGKFVTSCYRPSMHPQKSQTQHEFVPSCRFLSTDLHQAWRREVSAAAGKVGSLNLTRTLPLCRMKLLGTGSKPSRAGHIRQPIIAEESGRGRKPSCSRILCQYHYKAPITGEGQETLPYGSAKDNKAEFCRSGEEEQDHWGSPAPKPRDTVCQRLRLDQDKIHTPPPSTRLASTK